MKRPSLILSALCALAITGVTLGQLGWFGARGGRAASLHVGEAGAPARDHDNWNSAAASRWRHSQAMHWRSFVLQQ